MIADEQVTAEPSSLFSAQDQAAIRAQLKKRLILVLIPVLALLGAAIYFAIQRNEVATDVLTIVSLAALIFCYDLPAIAAGETVRVVHHELDVSDVVRV